MLVETPLGFNAQLEINLARSLSFGQFLKWEHQQLKSYIGEYVLKEDICSYQYLVKRDASGNLTRLSVPGKETTDIIESFKLDKGRRSKFEYEGFLKVKQRLTALSAVGSYFVILSPPGLIKEGFRGENGHPPHNFAYIGKVGIDKFEMVAFRNWLSLKEQANFANKFLSDQDSLPESPIDTDFLKTPFFLPQDLKVSSYLDVIKLLGQRHLSLSDHSNMFLKLHPFREKAILAIYQASRGLISHSQVEKALNAHENFARSLLSGERIRDYFYYAAFMPPISFESCGLGGRFFNSSLVDSLKIHLPGWMGIFGQDRYTSGTCVKCGKFYLGKVVWLRQNGGCGWCINCQEKDNKGQFDTQS